jgi:hypothetical protein
MQLKWRGELCEPSVPPELYAKAAENASLGFRMRLRTAASTPNRSYKRMWQFIGIRRLPRLRSPRRPKAGWMFLKKSKSFAFSIVPFLKYHPNVFET